MLVESWSIEDRDVPVELASEVGVGTDHCKANWTG